ncbi:putative RNA polymerase I-specific transcription initiation factor rrn5 [Rosellinia necatrix]|uniref:Putative RNA polymerase I-specific transcription initiation factor rrn5 n=1 Tax=Rosellinia necatrix TaxID=77044 RepID=A0A1W2TB42_ROSNE|nr:putative RNA polymerase I-specific transcription initiation factor rrn5 [Rosellinia necatrix]
MDVESSDDETRGLRSSSSSGSSSNKNTNSDHGFRGPQTQMHDSSPGALPIRGRAAKRRADAALLLLPPPPPLKRARGDFNAAYLGLLNRDIRDASSGLVHAAAAAADGDGDPDPADTHAPAQVGAVAWSAAEKRAFFEAVGRLGRAELAGVAARIGTKSELEVRQYLILLDDAAGRRQQRGNGSGTGGGGGEGAEARRGARHQQTRLVDVPAAAEISAECVAALEAAADAVSARQEGHEAEVERERWGARWLLTTPLAEALERSLPPLPPRQQQKHSRRPTPQPQPRERGSEDERRGDGGGGSAGQPRRKEEGREGGKGGGPDELPFLQLFSICDWLRLSDRVFMNSAVSDGNWHAVLEEPEPPAIRATAFADFHGLALSVTRRLVSAAIYVADSRLRANSSNDARRRGRRHIRIEDVAAAVSSLGMKRDSKEFWARCARRLQLNIVDDGLGEDDLTDRESEGADVDSDEGMDRDDQSHAEESGPGSIDEGEEGGEESEEDAREIMSYAEVEAALGYPVADDLRSRHSTPEPSVLATSEEEADDEDQEEDEEEEDLRGHAEDQGDDDYDYDDDDDDDGEYTEDVEMEDPQETAQDESDADLSPDAIDQDVEEAMLSLARVERAGAAPTRRALVSRIRAEHGLEREAEQLDLETSAATEAELWAVLRGDGGGSRKTKGSKG